MDNGNLWPFAPNRGLHGGVRHTATACPGTPFDYADGLRPDGMAGRAVLDANRRWRRRPQARVRAAGFAARPLPLPGVPERWAAGEFTRRCGGTFHRGHDLGTVDSRR